MCDDASGHMPAVDELDALERSLNYFFSMFIDTRKSEPPAIADNAGCCVLEDGGRRRQRGANCIDQDDHAIAGEHRHDIRRDCLTSARARSLKAGVK
jgi:hypothetical protein